MTTITREWLQKTIADMEVTRDDIPFGFDEDQSNTLAALKIALASLDAEPVRYLNKFSGTCVTLEQQSNAADDVAVYVPLFAAPPVPVVPEEITDESTEQRLMGRRWAPSFCAGWNACREAMLQGIEPVSQTYNLPELIEGMEVSIDVSTCDADAGNRYFGTVTEVSELYTAKNGYILLVQDAKPNFDVNGNSPAIPDDWISCSERIPAQDDWVLIYSKHGEYLAGQVQGEYVELNDGTLSWLGSALHWMLLPEPLQQEVK
ncbi:DUF551 domain-containing protein [Salmonella enterica subsp. enterica serovar Sandiego]|nr:DUF551 domain-containing protein [Salmonella enterica subsp. enterica serovar Sandiego]